MKIRLQPLGYATAGALVAGALMMLGAACAQPQPTAHPGASIEQAKAWLMPDTATMGVWKDPDTGCEYIITRGHDRGDVSITPRWVYPAQVKGCYNPQGRASAPDLDSLG